MNLVPKSNTPVSSVVGSALSLGGGLLLLAFRFLSVTFPVLGVVLGGALVALGAYTTIRHGNNTYDQKGGSYSLLAGGLLIASIIPGIGSLARLAMMAGGLFFSLTGGIRLLRFLRRKQKNDL